MVETLLWMILLITLLAATCTVAQLFRRSTTSQDIGNEMREELRASREEARAAAKDLREELSGGLKLTNDALLKIVEASSRQLKELTDSNRGALDGIRGTLDGRVKELQDSNEKKLYEIREEVSNGLRVTSDSLSKTLEGLGAAQHLQLEAMTKQLKELAGSNQSALDGIRGTIDSRVKELQDGNEKKLEEMRKTVDDR